jgi:ketosteroid isomerase-like protein
MKHRCLLLVAVLLLGPVALPAQDKSKDNDQQSKKEKKEDPNHEELREVKKALTDAFKNKDLDALLKHVHKNVVVTWQNGEVSRGHDGIRKYYDRMLTGNDSVLDKVDADPELPELSILYGDPPRTAVAFGKLHDKYKLRDGTDIDMQSLFSATLAKQDGKWLIVNFHASTNVFDNDVLKLAVSKTMWLAGGIAGIAGLILGLIVGRLMGSKTA